MTGDDVTSAAFLKWTLWLDGALFGLALLLAFVLSGSFGSVAGVLVGGALGTANLAGLGWLGRRLVGPLGPRWPYGLALGLKFVVLVAIVYLAVRYVPMDIVWFVVGLSVSGLAILGGALHLSLRRLDLTLE